MSNKRLVAIIGQATEEGMLHLSINLPGIGTKIGSINVNELDMSNPDNFDLVCKDIMCKLYKDMFGKDLYTIDDGAE